MGCFASKNASATQTETVRLVYASPSPSPSLTLTLDTVRVPPPRADPRSPAWAPRLRARESEVHVRLVFSPTPSDASSLVPPPDRDLFRRNQTAVKVPPPGVDRRRRWRPLKNEKETSIQNSKLRDCKETRLRWNSEKKKKRHSGWYEMTSRPRTMTGGRCCKVAPQPPGAPLALQGLRDRSSPIKPQRTRSWTHGNRMSLKTSAGSGSLSFECFPVA
ncbi:hypothetical protein IWX46DRAFT_582382 [Phyllosticta citricarpa]|uniref:Uncharacterized protein n=1 Tax=Phyllosticta citricarpa TaxID=55181 RepID=A0ABR1M3E6_9PEZI